MGSKRVADMTPEELERMRAYKREWSRRYYRSASPEKRADMVAAAAARNKRRREKASPEELARMRVHEKELREKRWSGKTKREREAARKKKHDYMRRYNRTPGAVEARRARFKRKYYDASDPGWRDAWLRRHREYCRAHRGGLHKSFKEWYDGLPEERRKAMIARKYAGERAARAFDASVRLMSPAAQA